MYGMKHDPIRAGRCGAVSSIALSLLLISPFHYSLLRWSLLSLSPRSMLRAFYRVPPPNYYRFSRNCQLRAGLYRHRTLFTKPAVLSVSSGFYKGPSARYLRGGGFLHIPARLPHPQLAIKECHYEKNDHGFRNSGNRNACDHPHKLSAGCSSIYLSKRNMKGILLVAGDAIIVYMSPHANVAGRIV